MRAPARWSGALAGLALLAASGGALAYEVAAVPDGGRSPGSSGSTAPCPSWSRFP